MSSDPSVLTTDSDSVGDKRSNMAGKTDIKHALKKEGHLLLPIKGVSMMPMLRQNQDCVVVEAASFSQLKPIDVVLYFNPERDAYILHRLLWKESKPSTAQGKSRHSGDGVAVILGDNCVTLEYVPEDWILGRLTSFFRGEKEVKLTDPTYQNYVALWVKPWKTRIALLKAKGRAHRVASKVKHAIIPSSPKKQEKRQKREGM